MRSIARSTTESTNQILRTARACLGYVSKRQISKIIKNDTIEKPTIRYFAWLYSSYVCSARQTLIIFGIRTKSVVADFIPVRQQLMAANKTADAFLHADKVT